MEELTPGLIYWIMQADTIRSALIIFSVVGVIITAIILFSWSAMVCGHYENDKAWAKSNTGWFMIMPVLTCILLVMSAVYPSTKTFVMMYGIPASIEVVKDAALSETAQKTVKSVNKLLDKYLKEE